MKYASGLLLLSFASALGSTPASIRVGLIIPETRQDRVTVNPWGLRQRQGFELALEGVKAVQWEIRDNSESAILAREKAIEYSKSGVDLIAGLSFSDQAMAVKQQSEIVGIPFLTVFGTSESLFDREKSVFTMGISNEMQVDRLVEYLSRFPSAKSTGVGLVVARNCEYCVDMERVLKALLSKRNISITQYQDILKNRPVPTDYLMGMELPELLVILAYEVDGLSVVNALAKRRYRGVVMGGDTWSTQTMQVANNVGLLSSICLVNPVPYDVNASSPVNRAFVERYQKKFGEVPTDVAALAFDAGSVISRVSTKCGRSAGKRSCISTAMAGLDFEGVSGRVKFSNHGRRVDTGVLLKSNNCSTLETASGYRK